MEWWSFKVVKLDVCGSLVLSNPVTNMDSIFKSRSILFEWISRCHTANHTLSYERNPFSKSWLQASRYLNVHYTFAASLGMGLLETYQ